MVIIMDIGNIAIIGATVISIGLIYYRDIANKAICKLKEIDDVIDMVIAHYEDDESIDSEELNEILEKIRNLM